MEKKKKKIYLIGSLFLSLLAVCLFSLPSVSLADPTNLWSDGTGSILYYNAGNVGIGTTGPATNLDVLNTTSTRKVAMLRRGTQGSDSSMVTTFGTPYLLIGGSEYKLNSIQTIGFGFGGATEYRPAEIGFQTTGGMSDHTFGDIVFANRISQTNVAPTEVMRITNAGNVGIGTTSPSQKLYVSGNIYATGNITCGGTCGGSSGSSTFIGLTDVPSTFTGHAGECVRVNSGATALEFFTCPSGSITNNFNALSSMIEYIIELVFLIFIFGLSFYGTYYIIKKIL